MNKINTKVNWAHNAVDRALHAAQNIAQNVSADSLKNRLAKLEELYHEFVENIKKLYAFANVEGYVDPSEQESTCEQTYYTAHDLLSRALSERLASATANDTLNASDTLTQLASQQSEFLKAFSSTTIHAEVPFEKLKIPTFTGAYQDWPSFHDLFMGAIGNKPGLSNTQKFHYLKSYLTGEALSLIKHLAITEENYTEALSRLEARYNRKPLIVRSFIQSFFSLPTLTSPNVVSLRKISDGADEVIRGLKALQSDKRDPWLIHILLKKVDNDTKQAWAEKHDTRKETTIDEFLDFLTLRCDALESCQTPRSSSTRQAAVTNIANSDEKQEEGKKQSIKRCIQCDESHALYNCEKFKALDYDAKCSLVKTHNLCFNCFGPHRADKCTSTFRCRSCKSKHHSLLHKGQAANKTTTTKAASGSAATSAVTSSASSINAGSDANNSTTAIVSNHLQEVSFCVSTQTLLPTIKVQVKDVVGNFVCCRLLLDTGSTASLVSEDFVQRLGISRKHARVPIAGLACTNAGISRGQVNIELLARNSTNKKSVNLLVMAKITSTIPAQLVDCSSSTWAQISKLDLADPTFGVPGPIDALIGCDQLWSIYTGECIQFGPDLPVALRTIFGWVVSGPCDLHNVTTSTEVTHHAHEDIDSMVRSLLEMDNISTSAKVIDNLDPTEAHFSQTFTREKDGTYVVEYPFKEHSPPIDFTLPSAMKRLSHIERRFRADANLKQQYVEFMNAYRDLGHMQLIPADEVDVDKSKCYYLPHHAVLKPSSSTTKCRVVFDGSCKDASGVSLNDRLHIGPPIQRDLMGVSLRFRQHRFVFSADIAKMFRVIKISPKHADFQRIVWREQPNAPYQHFRLLTVTYGLAPSPFLAVRVLKQLADDYKLRYPRAAQVLARDAYVDDIPTGCDSIEELITLKNELIALLNEANFKLRKWSSNCWPLLETIPKEHCELDAVSLLDKDASVKILGLSWNPCRDELFLKVEKPNAYQKVTKRLVLSELSKIYDPLGIVAPTVVLFKSLFQETWSAVKGWDDELPSSLSDRWSTYTSELPLLSELSIPRYISAPFESIELQAFADASNVAVAAVIYSRIKMGDAYVTKLIASKTRVAPLKPLSIPRLELNAAVLLSRLVSLVKSSLSIPISDVFCWSDSQVVLHWLSSPPRQWNVFVCNRTAEILESCPRNRWHHVKTEDNPADCASRGLVPSKLIKHHLWWSGPAWLSLPADEWPMSAAETALQRNPNVLAEIRHQSQRVLLSEKSDDVIDTLINNISSWTKLVRILAYCLRYIKIRIGKFKHPFGDNVSFATLTTSERKQSQHLLFRHMQMKAFSTDLKALKEKCVPPHKSRLIR